MSRPRRALWWPELELTPRIGSEVSERWAEGEGDERVSRDASGHVDVVVPEHALGFRWKEAGDARMTAVLITLRTLDDGTAITVTETGFDSLTDAAARAAASQDGWNILLRDLAAAAEADTGEFADDEVPRLEDEAEPEPQPEPGPEDEAADTGSVVEASNTADTADTVDEIDASDVVDTADTAEIELQLNDVEAADTDAVDTTAIEAVTFEADTIEAELGEADADDADVIEVELVDGDVIDEEAEDNEADVIEAEPEAVIDFDELIRGPR